MTTVTVEGVERACAATEWLADRSIDYQLTGTGVVSSATPRYHFMFTQAKDAIYFALRWK